MKAQREKKAVATRKPEAERLAAIREVFAAVDKGSNGHVGDWIDSCIPETAKALRIPTLALAMITGAMVVPSFADINTLRDYMQQHGLDRADVLGVEG